MDIIWAIVTVFSVYLAEMEWLQYKCMYSSSITMKMFEYEFPETKCFGVRLL